MSEYKHHLTISTNEFHFRKAQEDAFCVSICNSIWWLSWSIQFHESYESICSQRGEKTQEKTPKKQQTHTWCRVKQTKQKLWLMWNWIRLSKSLWAFLTRLFFHWAFFHFSMCNPYWLFMKPKILDSHSNLFSSDKRPHTEKSSFFAVFL